MYAFNQQSYVEQAVKAAFQQTYSPLQVILSDDHSTDATFSIIQEHAAAYSGPHCIFTNRTPHNLGTVDHLLKLVPQMKGELIVLAAGDDVSLPDRGLIHVDEWQRTGARAFCRAAISSMSTGKLSDTMSAMDFPPSNGLRAYFDHPGQTDPRAASPAYDRRAFALLDPPPDLHIIHEDVPMNIFLNATGKPIHFVDRTLVNYRQHEASTTNAAVQDVTATYIRDYENWASVSAKSLRNATAYFVKTCTPERHKINFAELNRRLRYWQCGE